jgi:hypothetical protein
MAAQTPDAWVDEFTRLTDSDAELNAHGRYYDCDFLLDMQERSFLVRMHRGKVDELIVDPGPLEHYQFAIRAPVGWWRNYAQETPPPMYHGFWAGAFRTDMEISGDVLVLMQNLRCFTHHLELLRATGAPV